MLTQSFVFTTTVTALLSGMSFSPTHFTTGCGDSKPGQIDKYGQEKAAHFAHVVVTATSVIRCKCTFLQNKTNVHLFQKNHFKH